MSITFNNKITTLLLDIEGTVCPITFVKDGLFPYFLDKLPFVLSRQEYPITEKDGDNISKILVGFPEEYTKSEDELLSHISGLVKNDVKDKTLKSLQGFIWQEGYENGEIKAPLYDDAMRSIESWKHQGKSVYIYSSGSVKAQKLLFGHVDIEGESINVNSLLDGYFDITTSGYKFEETSYISILRDVKKKGEEVLFLSDNVKEIEAAHKAGLNGVVVIRPGNAELSIEDQEKYQVCDDFAKLDI